MFQDVPCGTHGRYFLREKHRVFHAARARVSYYRCRCCCQERFVILRSNQNIHSVTHILSISHNCLPADLLTGRHCRKKKPRRLPACPTLLTKLCLVWLCLLYYWSDMKRLRPVGPSLRQTLGERAHIMTSVCRWLQGRCCGFVLDRKVTEVGEQHSDVLENCRGVLTKKKNSLDHLFNVALEMRKDESSKKSS